MKQQEIKEMSTADLEERTVEVRAQYTKLKMNHAVSPLENPAKLTAMRKDVARMETELTKRHKESNK